MRIEFRDELKKEWVKVPGTKAYGDRTHWNIWYHPTEQYAVLAFRGTQVTFASQNLLEVSMILLMCCW
jgi:hypothetical protein